jgi:peptide/nickel transport system permease protein
MIVRFLVRRLLGLVVTLLVSSFVVFGSLYVAPGSPIGYLTGGRSLPPATIASIKAQYHLNDPFLTRYWDWLSGALHGNFGDSIVFRQPVGPLISARIPTTVMLVAMAAIIILVVGIAAGAFAALRGGRSDSGVLLIGSVGIAVPSFVAAIVLISVFAVNLGWFPVFGAGSGFVNRLWHLTLPAIALALSATAFVARVTRTTMREELAREHVETARTRGIPERLVVRRHVFRNALIPITTVGGLTVASLIAGSVVVEQAFGLSGIGQFLIQSVNAKDFAAVQAISLILVVAFVLVNTAVDITYALIDPRVSLATARA